jgi:hypothetical protein
MLELNSRQRSVLAEKLPDAANVAVGALVFGQFLGERPFSLLRAFGGVVVWVLFMALAILAGGGKDP